MTEQHDIVYILKNGIAPYELMYSLRSIEKNFPHNKVWFYGGKPQGLSPDNGVYFTQRGQSKWDKVKQSLIQICENDDITEQFFLFNDDFFVLKPFHGEFINYACGKLQDRIDELLQQTSKPSNYVKQMIAMKDGLEAEGHSTVNFDIHLPMLIDREDALKTLQTNCTDLYRSLYGNVKHIPYVLHEDVKIYSMTEVPGDSWDFCSTENKTFAAGAVGRWIRTKFNEPSRFER